MSEHTPGPWVVSPFIKHAVVKEHNETDARIIASTGFYSDAQSEEEALANGLLVSAAPDLLEACQGLLGYIDEGSLFSQRVDKAKAAIAKATGK